MTFNSDHFNSNSNNHNHNNNNHNNNNHNNINHNNNNNQNLVSAETDTFIKEFRQRVLLTNEVNMMRQLEADEFEQRINRLLASKSSTQNNKNNNPTNNINVQNDSNEKWDR